MKSKLIVAMALFGSILLAYSSLQQKQDIQQDKSTPNNKMPEIEIIDNGKKKSLQIKELKVNIRIVGNIAVTEMDMTFINELPRQLEGELLFPLSGAQTVNRFAMEINGKLREAVPVEKDKGRIVYEEIIRQNIDPALLEKTQGNIYRARVYPILPNSGKRVVIGYEEELNRNPEEMTYYLPLNFTEKLDNFELIAEVFSENSIPVVNSSGIISDNFSKSGSSYIIKTNKINFLANKPFSFSVPSSSSGINAVSEEFGNSKYFHIDILAEKLEPKEKPAPKNIVIFWDQSSSCETRDFERETALLEKYFNKFTDVKIKIVKFANKVYSEQDFSNAGNGFAKIKEHLKNTLYDGASSLGCLEPNKYSADEILLFSDGISNFPDFEFKQSNKPVYCINSLQINDLTFLESISNHSGGQLINLTICSDDEAANLLLMQPFSFISADYALADFDDVYPRRIIPVLGSISLSGKIKTGEGTLIVSFGYGNEIVKQYEIKPEDFKKTNAKGLFARIWAKKKIDELSDKFNENKLQIGDLGKEFNIVTKNTSLIILDRAEDYLKFKIEPPEELKEEFNKLKAVEINNRKNDSLTHISNIILKIDERNKWYSTNFEGTYTKPKAEKKQSGSSSNLSSPMMPANNDGNDRGYANGGSSQVISARTLDARESRLVVNSLSDTYSYASDTENQRVTKISLEPVANRDKILDPLQKADASEFNEVYFKLKKEYGKKPFFYAEAADIAFEKKLDETANRILSNLAELEPENPQFLRVLASRLRQAKLYDLCIKLYSGILNLRPEEPQSTRDLALALDDAGQCERAANLLYQLVFKTWSPRFPDVEMIALCELNRILNKNPWIDRNNFDKRFLWDMPVDVRIVMNWDSDNTDIDLWVEDPDGEKCGYNHTRTVAGGRISSDFTGGYGPEEFMVKKARNGSYSVQTNFFSSAIQRAMGPVTVYLELYTNYGRKNEKKELVMYRLKDSKEWIKIGKLEFER